MITPTCRLLATRATAIENRDPKTFTTITEALIAQVPQNKIAARLGVSESTIKRVRHQYADQFPKWETDMATSLQW